MSSFKLTTTPVHGGILLGILSYQLFHYYCYCGLNIEFLLTSVTQVSAGWPVHQGTFSTDFFPFMPYPIPCLHFSPLLLLTSYYNYCCCYYLEISGLSISYRTKAYNI